MHMHGVGELNNNCELVRANIWLTWGSRLDRPEPPCDKKNRVTRARYPHNFLATHPTTYRSQIASSTLILAQYDNEIEELEKTLQGLIAERLKVQDHVDGCRAALAPVRRLPPETMGQIFAPFSSLCTEPKNPSEGLNSLAKLDLLRLSRVCCHWHRLIMGTASLWSHIAVDAKWWPNKVAECAPFLDLLDTSPERGADCSLSIRFYSGSCWDVDGATLRLLAKHSQRWQRVDLRAPISQLEHISNVEGNLSALQTLSLRCMIESHQGDVNPKSIFQTAPRLTEVFLRAANPRLCPNLPWNQLLSFTYDAYNINDVGALLDLMQKVSHPEADFALRHLNRHFQTLPLHLPSVTSTIASFALEMDSYLDPDAAAQLVGAILEFLTLLRLHELSFLRGWFCATCWPLSGFLALSRRSSFSETLLSLDIRHVTLTEDDLIHSLASLTSLERLVISDPNLSPPHTLVTDRLLRHLTLTPDPASLIVPHLKYFICTSFFKFDAQVYFEFVASRAVPEHTLFHSVLRYFSGGDYDFDPGVHQKLLGLEATGGIRFQLIEIEEE
ncbi:hypothetical protein C8R43DRAFT_1108205 [Mycena crocata]|nr:hypothetical protein C8R43DRAFT_1108205 [Mycena crocata]